MFYFITQQLLYIHVSIFFTIDFLLSVCRSASGLFSGDLCSGLGLSNLHLKVYEEDDLGACGKFPEVFQLCKFKVLTNLIYFFQSFSQVILNSYLTLMQ